VRFYLPPEDLRPFVTTIYRLDVSPDRAGPIEDALHPEWANIRLITQGEIEARSVTRGRRSCRERF